MGIGDDRSRRRCDTYDQMQTGAVRLSLRKAVRSGSADAKTNGSRISHESWEPHIS